MAKKEKGTGMEKRIGIEGEVEWKGWNWDRNGKVILERKTQIIKMKKD